MVEVNSASSEPVVEPPVTRQISVEGRLRLGPFVVVVPVVTGLESSVVTVNAM